MSGPAGALAFPEPSSPFHIHLHYVCSLRVGKPACPAPSHSFRKVAEPSLSWAGARSAALASHTTVLVEGKGHVPLVLERSPHCSEARPDARQAAPSRPPVPRHEQGRPRGHTLAARGRRPSRGRLVPAVSRPRTGEGVRPPGPPPGNPIPRPRPRRAAGTLTEHGHELLGVEVPVAPVGPVAVQRGVLLVVVRGLRPKGVDDPDSAPAPPPREQEPGSAASRVSLGAGRCGRCDRPLAVRPGLGLRCHLAVWPRAGAWVPISQVRTSY